MQTTVRREAVTRRRAQGKPEESQRRRNRKPRSLLFERETIDEMSEETSGWKEEGGGERLALFSNYGDNGC